MNPETPVLSIRQLTTKLTQESVAYTVVDSLSLDLQKGETLALVGESGCGKSMTALSIMGILPKPPALPPTGQILYQGKNLLALSAKEMQAIRGAKISMIFQDPLTAFNPVYTIGFQLMEQVQIHLKLKNAEAKSVVLQALEQVALPRPHACMDSYPHQLSGGMLQRAMIAMAILCKPDILIADEPTTALDVTIQAQILQLLDELKKKLGMSILLITHDMGVVAEIADRVAVMYAAQIVEEGSALALFDNPAHPYTQALFQTRLGQNKKKGRLPTIKGQVPSLKEPLVGCRFAPRCNYRMEVCAHDVPGFPLPEQGHKAKCCLYDEHLKDKIPLHDEDS